MGIKEVLEKKSVINIKEKILKNEKKFINKTENEYVKEKISPIKEKVERKIPEKMIETLKKAFEKSFYFVFEKGTFVIEKSYNAEKLKEEAEINEYILSKRKNKKNIKRFDKSAGKTSLFNLGITGIEGTLLGFFGIGLPDIPVFIGMILKNIYEISMKYGFEYETDKEKIYILNLINLSICKQEERQMYSEKIDKIAYDIESNKTFEVNIDKEIKITSDNLVEKMIVSKFIQGIPVVGALGGVSNIVLLNKISNVSKLKYKKRMLNKI